MDRRDHQDPQEPDRGGRLEHPAAGREGRQPGRRSALHEDHEPPETPQHARLEAVEQELAGVHGGGPDRHSRPRPGVHREGVDGRQVDRRDVPRGRRDDRPEHGRARRLPRRRLRAGRGRADHRPVRHGGPHLHDGQPADGRAVRRLRVQPPREPHRVRHGRAVCVEVQRELLREGRGPRGHDQPRPTG